MLCKICQKRKCWKQTEICYSCRASQKALDEYKKLTDEQKKELNKIYKISRL